MMLLRIIFSEIKSLKSFYVENNFKILKVHILYGSINSLLEQEHISVKNESKPLPILD